MLIEILEHMFALDFGFIAGTLYGNLPVAFGLFCVAYYIGKGKKAILGFFVIAGLILGFLDLLRAHDFIFYTSTSLLIVYITRIAILAILTGKKSTEKYIPLGYSLATYGILLFYNFFMV